LIEFTKLLPIIMGGLRAHWPHTAVETACYGWQNRPAAVLSVGAGRLGRVYSPRIHSLGSLMAVEVSQTSP